MLTTTATERPATTDGPPLDAYRIQQAIEHAAHLLPAQGPITVFIHHNTLHGLEHLPFEDAVRQASEIFGCRPYLPEERYRQELAKGRIQAHDLIDVLLDSLGDEAEILVGFLGTRFHLRRAMLRHPLHSVLPNQLEWVIAENHSFDTFSPEASEEKLRLIAGTQRWAMRVWSEGISAARGSKVDQEFRQFQELSQSLLKKFNLAQMTDWRDSTWESFTLHLLWEICLRSVSDFPDRLHPQRFFRHRDYLLSQTGIDTDELVNEFLIRFGVVMLDQGLSRWHLPHRDQGWFSAFLNLYGQPNLFCESWLRKLSREIARIKDNAMSPMNCIAESLQWLGVGKEEVGSYIEQTALALRGYAGMIWQMEVRADRIAHGMKPGSVTEFLAVRFILERLAIEHVAAEGLESFPLRPSRRSSDFQVCPPSLAQLKQIGFSAAELATNQATLRSQAFSIFQLAQELGWAPEVLFKLTRENWHRLLEEIRLFDGIERQKIFHLAFERRYRQQSLDALLKHRRDALPTLLQSSGEKSDQETNQVQTQVLMDVLTCIDEREESLRRHLEEVEPQCRTWGFAGFFAVAMYYSAADSFQYVPLCPIVIEPKHYVQEIVLSHEQQNADRRTSLRRVVGKAQRNLHTGSRSLLTGALTSVLGVLMTIPLVARVLFPRMAAHFRKRVEQFHEVPAETMLQLERKTAEPGKEEDQIGFSLQEMADIVARVLRDIGMTENWSRLFIVLGHGSTTMNNPHESAYDCGACGGGRGGPNARAFTQMANDRRVRARLAQRGFVIPETTYFLGGFHNTCNDEITLLDIARVPASHRQDLTHASEVLRVASQRNAHERCRRFESADLRMDIEAAFRHVLARSEDLSQVRPELGHATNALCLVGRRALSRGLYMDRRAFMHSYDPTKDDAQYTILSRILAPVFPVCGGINLEYYFSHVDPEGYGCGTKLPHNIAALVGVMNGAASDLRTGLPWQMVEIHEPIRLLIVVENTPDALLYIMSRNEQIDRMVRGGWVQLVAYQPEQGRIQWFHHGRFMEHIAESDFLAQAPSSRAWYQSQRGHLDFAQIGRYTNPQVATLGEMT
jgi:uncharacterized protein